MTQVRDEDNSYSRLQKRCGGTFKRESGIQPLTPSCSCKAAGGPSVFIHCTAHCPACPPWGRPGNNKKNHLGSGMKCPYWKYLGGIAGTMLVHTCISRSNLLLRLRGMSLASREPPPSRQAAGPTEGKWGPQRDMTGPVCWRGSKPRFASHSASQHPLVKRNA